MERLCLCGARRDCVERTAVRRALKTGGWPGAWWVERGKNSGTWGREKGRGKSGVTACMLCYSGECGGHWSLGVNEVKFFVMFYVFNLKLDKIR